MGVSKQVEAVVPQSEILLFEQKNGIALLTLNQPENRNALSSSMLSLLSDRLDLIAEDKTVRVAVLAAIGPAFCSGHDLKELTLHRKDADRGRAFFIETMKTCSAVMQKITGLPQPVIAAVQGTATAAGCQLVASCDLAIASHEAQFATPGVNIGLFCSTPMVALSRNVSSKHAMEMLLTGEAVSADHAYRIGLVNQVVDPGMERNEALKLAAKIGKKSAMTLRTGKNAFYRQREMPLTEAYNYASKVMVENMLTRDAEEGISAFIEKRSPNWEDC